jgi:thiamine biosynthesis protein ThiI
MKMNCEMGGVILDNFKNYKVDVRKPQLLINIEIDKEKTIFYFEKHLGEGGFPIGINGRVLMLISGGIDSPVAAKLLMKKGLHVDFITFLTPPHTSNKVLEKVKKLIKIASHDSLLQRSKLFVCNFTPLQHELSHISDKSYQITLMRRYFYRIACDVAKKNKYSAIGTGESIGQVASQTLESMKVIQNSINDFLVLRPLLTYDKQEIINLSNKYKTYETSILPYEDCCTLFVPSNPQTRPKLDSAIKLESKLDMIEEIYKMVVEKIEIL